MSPQPEVSEAIRVDEKITAYGTKSISTQKASNQTGPASSRDSWSRAAASHSLAFVLRGSQVHDDDLYVMINAYWQDLDFVVQEGAAGDWLMVIDTSRSAPDDISEPGVGEPLSSIRRKVAARSVVVLVRNRSDRVKSQG